MKPLEIHGALVTLPLGPKIRPLDGFWLPGRRTGPRLLIFVHGMGGNFYRSALRKRLLLDAPGFGFDVLTFNNRGAEKDVATERFRDCVADIAAALAFARRKGYRNVVLMGHSTGCQKITYFQSLESDPLVKAVILSGPGDDLAVSRRDLGPRYAARVAQAKRLVKGGKGGTILPDCLNFAAHRFLSVGDPAHIEAQLFNFDGPMRHYRRLTMPVLVQLPLQEQYACRPVPETEAILRRKSRSRAFASQLIPDADHSFTGHERKAMRAALAWAARAVRPGGRGLLPR
jgi:pimeloyl-ACP methyl ester carboxylesterase